MYAKWKNLWGFVRQMTKENEDGWKPPNLNVHWGLFDKITPLLSASPPPFEVLDLHSFLTRMTEEGRPVVVEEAITKLEGILKATGAHLASVDDVAIFVADANSASKNSYY
jgi:hypothetical protein